MNWNSYKESIIGALEIFRFDEGILDLIRNSVSKNQRIFIGGNGGSAALSLHYAADLSKGANSNWEKNAKRLKAVPLTGSIGYITAISNDLNYDEIFKQQLINLASKNDILILISSSGNSPNIVKAAEYAKKAGLIVVGITGFDGGKLKGLSDYSAHLDFDSYEVCEDVHGIFGHFLSCYLRSSPD